MSSSKSRALVLPAIKCPACDCLKGISFPQVQHTPLSVSPVVAIESLVLMNLLNSCQAFAFALLVDMVFFFPDIVFVLPPLQMWRATLHNTYIYKCYQYADCNGVSSTSSGTVLSHMYHTLSCLSIYTCSFCSLFSSESANCCVFLRRGISLRQNLFIRESGLALCLCR